jgi:hypothetical protein
MNLQQLQNYVSTHKKGTYTKAQWKSEKVVNGDTYTKVSNGTIRFVSYESAKKPTTSTSTRKTNTIEIIKDICYLNTNTNNYLVYMYVIKNDTIKTKTSYYKNGIEITKVEYETIVKPNTNKPIDLMFMKKLQDIITLG